MQIIYVHGLHSNSQATKGQILREYCQQYYPHIPVLSPDLNQTPEQVLSTLRQLIAQDAQTVLVGSSLGGYFSTLLHNELGLKVILLNPSTQPNFTLLRFFPEHWRDLPDDYLADDPKASTWHISLADIRWFEQHTISTIRQPENVCVMLETGDELLDYRLAEQMFHNTHLLIHEGGDHRMSDFATKVEAVMQFATQMNLGANDNLVVSLNP